jgi:hypothetical protein
MSGYFFACPDFVPTLFYPLPQFQNYPKEDPSDMGPILERWGKKHAGDKAWRKWVDAGISASTSYIYRGAQVQRAKATQKIKPYIYWHRNTSSSLTIPSHQSYYLVPLTLATINSTPYRYQWLIVVPDISATPHSWHPSSSGHNILFRRT